MPALDKAFEEAFSLSKFLARLLLGILLQVGGERGKALTNDNQDDFESSPSNPFSRCRHVVVDPPGFSQYSSLVSLGWASPPMCVLSSPTRTCAARRYADRIAWEFDPPTLRISVSISGLVCVSCALEKCKKDKGSSAPVP